MQVRSIRNVVRGDGLVTGFVSSVTEDLYTIVLADNSTLEAARAASCLVLPGLRDHVLVYGVGGTEPHYVLAVLERAEAGALPVAAGGGLKLVAPEGRVTIEADRLAITARREATLSAPALQLGATELRFVFRELAMWGREIVSRADVVRAIAQQAHVLVESVHSRMARSTKVVSEIEHTSAKQLNYTVAETLSVHSKTSVLTAEELVKLDGKLVQLG